MPRESAPASESAIRLKPYWWERTPPRAFPEASLPTFADVVIIGSGYTGLHAAFQLARGGRSVLVVEKDVPGGGCSTRNGGQISTSIKPGLASLTRRYGEEQAGRIRTAGRESLAFVGDFIREEEIDCDFRVSGRFHGAHSEQQFRKLATGVDDKNDAELVPRKEQDSYIGSDRYFGGVFYRRYAALDPARYHAGLMDRVLAAGAAIFGDCEATAIMREGAGFRVSTQRGVVTARDVFVATNGYSGRLMPWLRRRIIPIGSYLIATEALSPGLIDRLLPGDRMITDTRRVVYYYRASPDRTRIVFGGRVSCNEIDPRRSASLLRAELVRIFPDLAGVALSHAWMGFVGYTFDALMHAGIHDGVHYAAGYCGSGVGMASYLGMKTGLRILGRSDGRTPFDDLQLPGRPYYRGNPWFLLGAIPCYRLLDEAPERMSKALRGSFRH